MHKLFALSAMAFLLTLAAGGAAEAREWSRHGTITTPRGTTTTQGSGSCANHACSWQHSATGPKGRTVSEHGSGSCANGSCNWSSTVTGPNGGGYTRTGTFTTTH
jgi:hypothetical protein